MKNEINNLKTNGFVENPLVVSNKQIDEIVNFLKSKPMHDPEQGLAGIFLIKTNPKILKEVFIDVKMLFMLQIY